MDLFLLTKKNSSYFTVFFNYVGFSGLSSSIDENPFSGVLNPTGQVSTLYNHHKYNSGYTYNLFHAANSKFPVKSWKLLSILFDHTFIQ